MNWTRAVFAVSFGFLLAATDGHAQSKYPDRPVKVVVGFTAGGGTDVAARIMAEDGVEDHGLAKRKAARQAGVADTRNLPGNDEIDIALREYREIYQPDAHREQLTELREIAVRAMTAARVRR